VRRAAQNRAPEGTVLGQRVRACVQPSTASTRLGVRSASYTRRQSDTREREGGNAVNRKDRPRKDPTIPRRNRQMLRDGDEDGE